MRIVGILNDLLICIIALGWSIQALGLIALFFYIFERKRVFNPALPLWGVSIIKPCCGNQDNESENFDSFFNQDYPGKFQIIFSVSEESDPIVPVIQSYLKKYPQVDAELVISKTRNANSKKVDALYDAHQRVKH